MKNKKVMSLVLTSAMTLSLAACGGNPAPVESSSAGSEQSSVVESSTDIQTPDTAKTVADELAEMDYDAASSYLFERNLGDFYSIYEAAKEEKENLSLRYAKMAIAEAKLMEDAAMLPLQTRGGNYAISRVAPRSGSSVLWGNDADRFHSLIVTTEPLTKEVNQEMKQKWTELVGTGTYQEWAKNYLVEKGYTLKDTYTYGAYTSDAATWDVLATSKQADSEKIIHTYDGLMEYDCENVLQPALAESYEVSADGLTYTFKIRQGQSWVDSQGRKVADVKADDFVAGMQHMMDAMGGLEYLVQGVIVNADEYINGVVTDFSEVGVKAIDDYTLQYTVTEPCPYFMTMLGYGVFAPMSRDYYVSQGGKFGAEYDPSADSYKYGKGPDSIAYCGPYLVTNLTEKNTIVFQANPSYWNADNVNIKTMTWLFNDGADALKPYNDMKAGVLDGTGLNASALEQAKQDGWFDQYSYVSATDATSFCGFYNFNRAAFANVNDNTAAKSSQTPEVAAKTREAMNNVHFRRALSMALDRASYNAQGVGEELKLNSLRNTYTPGNFVLLTEEVTVDINGKATTYPAGTFYGKIMQDQIDADGVKIKVWDEVNATSDGFDGWYNPANAAAELEIAISELAQSGITVDAANPVQIDLPYPSNNETYTNRATVYKQSVEAALGGKVIINLVECVNNDEWYYAGYDTSYGYEANYDIYDLSGWGPDYGDPQTYLDTMLPDYAGYMTKCMGIF